MAEHRVAEGMLLSKPVTISIAGKGGAGKTSITALLLRTVLESSHDFSEILVVDADPASNVADILGIKHVYTIGCALDRKKAALAPGSKTSCNLLRDEILGCITQADRFDHLVMGRTTGEGCYCPLNTILKQLLDEALRLYDLVMIDFDAGLEHFSRQTDANSDILLVVTDPSRMGFETARRIRELTDELDRNYRHRFLVGCRFSKNMEAQFYSYAEMTGLSPLGLVPFDEQLLAANLEGKNIFQLAPDSLAYQSIGLLWKTLSRAMATVKARI